MSEERDEIEEWANGREGAKARIEASKARRTENELRRVIRLLEGELEFERRRLDGLIQLVEAPEVYTMDPGPSTGSKNRAVSVALASDLHVEERVDPKTVSGLNEHNLAIAEAKLDRYWRNVVKLVHKEQASVEIRTHVQWLGGDLFSGHIHEDLVEVSELSPSESILWLRERISAGIKYLLAHLDVEKILIPCNFGNHGRTTIKPRIATEARHSWEWLLYQVLNSDFNSEPRVEFIITQSYHQYLDIGGFVIRFHHGDGFNFLGGVGGLTVPMNRSIAEWNKSRRADLDVLGHWHQLFDAPSAVVNGSLIGMSAYSIKKVRAGYEPPQQGFFLVDLDRRRKTIFAPVFVL